MESNTLSETVYNPFKRCSLKEMHAILIRSLNRFAIRGEMFLPILLLIGKSKNAMIKMMFYLKEKSPSEDEIIQMALELENDA